MLAWEFLSLLHILYESDGREGPDIKAGFISLTFHTILASIIVINPVDNLSQIFIFLFLVSPLLVSIFVLNEIKKTEKQETPPKLKEKNKSKD